MSPPVSTSLILKIRQHPPSRLSPLQLSHTFRLVLLPRQEKKSHNKSLTFPENPSRLKSQRNLSIICMIPCFFLRIIPSLSCHKVALLFFF
ncbi:hypothetical protein L5515_019463 [Caenorhabditis briggsae]|uniref:Uncharacterized protein n=1 Tax=Caenorhabditis briggsae TaxID=6238 RepID=A0AAE9FLV1_CAEBR|nr:hypothetical protein L5515_019463 [Caenorhabditis briggsae]